MNAPKNAPVAGQNPPAKKNREMDTYLKIYEKEIAKALPQQIGSKRFQRICATALTQNPELRNCSPESFIGAVLNSAQLGLEPNTPLGQAYLIPYNNRRTGKKECTFQLGYKGLLELARRSGQISMIKAHAVHENDKFSYTLGLNPTLEHEPAYGDRGQVVAYYAFYKTKDGDFDFEVMTKAEVAKHRDKYSKAGNSPWNTDFDEMAKKTVVKKVLKYAPMSTEIAAQVQTDESVKSFDKTNADLMSDMASLPNETIIDGEIIEDESAEAGADSGNVNE